MADAHMVTHEQHKCREQSGEHSNKEHFLLYVANGVGCFCHSMATSRFRSLFGVAAIPPHFKTSASWRMSSGSLLSLPSPPRRRRGELKTGGVLTQGSSFLATAGLICETRFGVFKMAGDRKPDGGAEKGEGL